MCDRNRFMFVTLVLSCLIISTNGFAATVTVNASASPEPGIRYNTIRAAAENLAGGDAWGNGSDDTILVTDDAVVIEDAQVNVHPFEPGTSVTIRNTPGDTPIVALSVSPSPHRLFYINESILMTFDGLTLIGGDGTNPDPQDGDDVRTCFGMEADDPGDVVNCTIRNCVVTRNKGGNVPELDYSAEFEPTGTFQRAIFHGDEVYRGLISCTVEDSVFAFFYARYAGIQFDRQVDPQNPNSPATRVLTFRRTLLTKCGDNGHGVRARDVGPETTYNFIDSCITGTPGRGMLFGLNDLPEIGVNINIIHSIIDDTGGTPAPINIDGKWDGTLMIDGATLVRPGGDMILVEKQTSGDGTFVFKNLISAPPDDSILYWFPENGTSKPGSLTVSNINTDGPAARATQHPSIKSAFAADYGGTGPFPDNPLFLSTQIDSSYTGIRKWDSTTNTLFDVGNPSFSGKGTGGANLVGGAECPSCSATEVNDWALY
jgi:hypothetical protein